MHGCVQIVFTVSINNYVLTGEASLGHVQPVSRGRRLSGHFTETPPRLPIDGVFVARPGDGLVPFPDAESPRDAARRRAVQGDSTEQRRLEIPRSAPSLSRQLAEVCLLPRHISPPKPSPVSPFFPSAISSPTPPPSRFPRPPLAGVGAAGCRRPVQRGGRRDRLHRPWMRRRGPQAEP
jgi:hypothetical protein